MIKYPLYLDENTSRAIAMTVFTLGLITLLRPEFSWIMIMLFIDFILRYIHPKLSPLVLISMSISQNLLHMKKNPKFSPPKRFAILIGMIFTGIISFAILLVFPFIQSVFTMLLLIAAYLQGFYGYCVGCKIYDILVKMGIINRNKTIGKNTQNLIKI